MPVSERDYVSLFLCKRSGALTHECPSPNYACEYACDDEEVQFVRASAYEALQVIAEGNENTMRQWEGEATRLRAEVERLREALCKGYVALDTAFSPQVRKCSCGDHPADIYAQAVGSALPDNPYDALNA